jgi:hypothetical protein
VDSQAGVPADRRKKYCRYNRYTCRYRKYRRKYRRYQERYKGTGRYSVRTKYPAEEQEELADQLGGTWRPRRGPSLWKRLQKKGQRKIGLRGSPGVV